MPKRGLKILKYARFGGFVNYFLYLCTWFNLHVYVKEGIIHQPRDCSLRSRQ